MASKSERALCLRLEETRSAHLEGFIGRVHFLARRVARGSGSRARLESLSIESRTVTRCVAERSVDMCTCVYELYVGSHVTLYDQAHIDVQIDEQNETYVDEPGSLPYAYFK